jgi:hypothetical protein
MKDFTARWFELLFVSALALIPILWYVPGHWSFGVDPAFPPNPIQIFLRRQFIWNGVFLGGTDRSLDLPNTEIFIGMQAALSAVGLNLGGEQTIVNIFWFGLEGFSFYYFMRVLFKGNDLKTTVIRLTGTTFYTLNFYQIYLWGNIQVAPVATVIATPLTLAVITRSLEQGGMDRTSLLVMLAASILGSAMGTEPPSLFAYAFIVIAYFVFLSLVRGYWKTLTGILTFVRIFSILAGIFVLANMYWILPSANFIISSNYLNTQFGSQVYSVAQLLPQTSQFTSFLNVFRVLGELFFYTGFGGQPYSPWFSAYQTNIILVSLSFLLPILAFAALLVSSRNAKVLFFSAFALVILFLVKGTHDPFGWVYSWLVANVPGFWIFRAPWEHFFSVGIICVAFLAAVTCGWIFQSVDKRSRLWAVIIIGIIILSTVGYNQAFILGKMTYPTEGDVGYSEYYNVGYDRVIPDYVFQASNWVNGLNQDVNIYMLPASTTNVYDWGYASATDFIPTLFNKGVLEEQYGQGAAPPNSMQLMYNMFAATLNGSPWPNASKILSLLNVGYVLERQDFVYNFFGGTDSPSFIESQLNTLSGLHEVESFGAWDFYSNSYVLPKIYGASNLVFVNGSLLGLDALTNTQYIQGLNALYFSSQQPASQTSLASTIASVSINEQNPDINSVVNSTSTTFSWYSGNANGLSNSSYPIVVAKDYIESKPVISTDGIGTPDMLVFNSTQNAPYVFPNNATSWSATNSTLVYVQTGSSPLEIDSISTNGVPATNVVGVWWESGWEGMSTRAVAYPIMIPAHQKAIIQINQPSTTVQLGTTSLSFDNATQTSTAPPQVSFSAVNPTTYQVNVSTSHPFVLVFSAPYDPQWEAYYGTPQSFQLFNQQVPEKDQLMVNGYANGWYISSTGNFTMTLYYTPQNLYYLGLSISVIFGIALFAVPVQGCSTYGTILRRFRRHAT